MHRAKLRAITRYFSRIPAAAKTKQSADHPTAVAVFDNDRWIIHAVGSSPLFALIPTALTSDSAGFCKLSVCSQIFTESPWLEEGWRDKLQKIV
jgi:hypothetical protein